MSEMKWHPAACIFPMLPDDELQALADDIKANGQKEPIALCDGMVIDGRNRSLACEKAGVEPVTVNKRPKDPVAFVLSMNLHRRHLSPSQAAMCAARAKDLYEQQAKERQIRKPADSVVENLPRQKGKARDQAGKAFGVSGKSVDFATKVIQHGTKELIDAVDSGRMAVSTAAIHAMDPPEEQMSAIEKAPNRNYAAISKPRKTKADQDSKPEPKPGVSRGVGIEVAHEAIACLKRIPKNDALRKRGFQVVADWIKHNS